VTRPKIVQRVIDRMRGREDPRSLPDIDPWVQEIVDLVCPSYTMTGAERVNALCKATEYAVVNDIRGAFVECGVWRGGSMMAVALTLLRLHATDRELYLFDTFSGMTTPTDLDVDFRGNTAKELLEEQPDIATSSLVEVRRNMELTGYPSEHIHFVVGRVEDTLPAQAPDAISILRLDTDWYESTRHELRNLGPRLTKGGVLIIDDYGYWAGSRRAVDEYLSEVGWPMLLHRIDAEGRIGIVT
jgi:O-methyltransferase